MRLVYLFLGPMALLLLAGCGSVISTSSENLRTFVGCAVREFTFLAKKPGCRGLRITTDACWGRCETWEVSPKRGSGGNAFMSLRLILKYSKKNYFFIFIFGCAESSLLCVGCPYLWREGTTLVVVWGLHCGGFSC